MDYPYIKKMTIYSVNHSEIYLLICEMKKMNNKIGLAMPMIIVHGNKALLNCVNI